MKVPTIHMNGSGAKALLEQVENAHRAVVKAREAIEAAWPNGRDYYPQGASAIREAESEWRERVRHLLVVQNELQALHEAIFDAANP